MATTPEIRESLDAIEAEMRLLLAGSGTQCEHGYNIWKSAMNIAHHDPEIMWPMWLIWGALTDWIENRPEETKTAEEKMSQAAREWIELNSESPQAMNAYFDRWVYDEMGYERDS